MKSQEELDLEKQIAELQIKQVAMITAREKQEQIDKEDKQKKAAIVIEARLKEVYKEISELEKIAEDAGVCFDFSVEYGMGGSFHPKSMPNYNGDVGWISSSANC